ncbi:tryptophan-rich sensory protein [Nocardioides mangrovicus]|uniref:Tryptophan-rich sensory protein n=1 Tax=Nocardioides mangrovicus TaxID=2478913 RepID=A0A3L8NZC2_9ACTN|nr:TspO/MBR family protein [Nocardioides mangrovicus]RLV48131.1 tryptophan-rich sensory protein [Nocardioides mangrovicus]
MSLRRNVVPVVLGAVVGGLGVRPTSRWYRALDKPRWNPPNAVFGPVWTALYALTAYGTARAMERGTAAQVRGIERALWTNMALNAGWCWLFFTAERPRLALAEILALDASTADLLRRLREVDPTAHHLVAPYLAWNSFATALNAEIARRN